MCEEKLRKAHDIQQRFRQIDEYWHGKCVGRNDQSPFATVILDNPSTELDIKLEPAEYVIENEGECVQNDDIKSIETEEQPPPPH